MRLREEKAGKAGKKGRFAWRRISYQFARCFDVGRSLFPCMELSDHNQKVEVAPKTNTEEAFELMRIEAFSCKSQKVQVSVCLCSAKEMKDQYLYGQSRTFRRGKVTYSSNLGFLFVSRFPICRPGYKCKSMAGRRGIQHKAS